MGKLYEEVDKILAAEIPRINRQYILEEVSKGEGLFEQVTEGDPSYGDVLERLTKIYQVLNYQLGLVCKAVDYPPKQWEWPDSKPLEVLAWCYHGIQESKWYTRHLNTIILPRSDAGSHPWLEIVSQ